MNKLIVNYENVTQLPCVLDKNFKIKLEELLNSLDKNSDFILLIYSYSSTVSPLKRRGDTLISQGVYLCPIVYRSSYGLNNEIFSFIKNMFLNKINYYNSLSEDIYNESEFIFNSEISFVKVFDITDHNDSIEICGNDPIKNEESEDKESDDEKFEFMDYSDQYNIGNLDKNEMEFYNNSFYSKNLFKDRSFINYNKVLLCSANGLKERILI